MISCGRARSLYLVLGIVLCTGVSRAEVPATINYQGQVLGAGGAPASGPVNIDIGIWDSASGGTRLYGEQHLNTPLASGAFNILIGAGSSPQGTLSSDTFSAPNRWLELVVNGETFTPRQPFSAVAYALRARDAERVGGLEANSLMSRSGGSFTGAVRVDGPNGKGNISLGGLGDNPNHGLISVLDANGAARAQVLVNAGGQGVVSLFNPSGGASTTIGGGQNGGLIATFGNSGQVATLLSETTDGSGLIVAYNGTQQARALMSGVADVGVVEMVGPNGQDNVLLGATATNANHGSVAVDDATGTARASLFVNDAGNGQLSVQRGTGAANGGATVLLPGGVTVNDDGGVVRAQMTIDPAGQGVVDIVRKTGPPLAGAFRVRDGGDAFLGLFGPVGAAGNVNVLLGAVDGDPNRGSVAVFDRNSVAKAGLFVNAQGKGQLFADLKNFVVDHPTQPGKQIVYTSLEGPEVAIYHRGVVQLDKGRAVIELPEHFAVLAAPGSVTVQLTPASLQSLGVAIVSVTVERIEIGELYGGTGAYDVHYVVHALRRGYEDQQPVVAADEMDGQTSRAGAAALAAVVSPVLTGGHADAAVDAPSTAVIRAAASAADAARSAAAEGR